mmetsp:Transcript_39654/g.93140  ORF Transcript_39654/g.93140 Transcript_39654/m.93140 type:complete len:230 (+) Transcript_39654:204-893(+)
MIELCRCRFGTLPAGCRFQLAFPRIAFCPKLQSLAGLRKLAEMRAERFFGCSPRRGQQFFCFCAIFEAVHNSCKRPYNLVAVFDAVICALAIAPWLHSASFGLSKKLDGAVHDLLRLSFVEILAGDVAEWRRGEGVEKVGGVEVVVEDFIRRRPPNLSERLRVLVADLCHAYSLERVVDVTCQRSGPCTVIHDDRSMYSEFSGDRPRQIVDEVLSKPPEHKPLPVSAIF